MPRQSLRARLARAFGFGPRPSSTRDRPRGHDQNRPPPSIRPTVTRRPSVLSTSSSSGTSPSPNRRGRNIAQDNHDVLQAGQTTRRQHSLLQLLRQIIDHYGFVARILKEKEVLQHTLVLEKEAGRSLESVAWKTNNQHFRALGQRVLETSSTSGQSRQLTLMTDLLSMCA